MNVPRYRHAMVSTNGKLYVAGGYGSNLGQPLKSVECFYPTTRVWTTIAPMNEARGNLGLAVLGNKLYAIGGDGLSSVECLDLSIPDGQWTPVASMTMPRFDFGAVVTGGKIYAIGGRSTESSMECFDPSDGMAGRWTDMAHTHTSKFHTAANFAVW